MNSWIPHVGHSRTQKALLLVCAKMQRYNNNLLVIKYQCPFVLDSLGNISMLCAKMSEPCPDPHQYSARTWKNITWYLTTMKTFMEKIIKAEWGKILPSFPKRTDVKSQTGSNTWLIDSCQACAEFNQLKQTTLVHGEFGNVSSLVK